MFRTIILPICRSTRLCITACGIIHLQCCRQPGSGVPPLPGYRLPATLQVYNTTSCNTRSSAPEDGQDHRPKHVELIGIINKPLLLHLVGVYIICSTNVQIQKFILICSQKKAKKIGHLYDLTLDILFLKTKSIILRTKFMWACRQSAEWLAAVITTTKLRIL